MAATPVQDILGNAPKHIKQRCVSAFTDTQVSWSAIGIFGADVWKEVRLKSFSLDEDPDSPLPGRQVARMICEMEVTESE